MDYSVRFTPRALGDLADIIGRIAEDDPAAASQFGNALLDHVDLLRRFPLMGALIGTRSRVRRLVHSPIIVYYRLRDRQQAIDVLHFRHGARRPPRF